MQGKFRLVIHGGAGVILKSKMTPALEESYRSALSESLLAGHDVLKAGGTSLEAVIAAIKCMEDSPMFNAGKGSVFTHEGTHEMDASIMEGKTLKAGAVAAVKTIKNPITAACAVMNKTQHVLLIGEGADKFALANGIEVVEPSYFYTERRWEQLQKVKASQKVMLDHNIELGKKGEVKSDEKSNPEELGSRPEDYSKNKYLGTVGAVALDINGDICAGTSTGGMTNKMFGRVGDSPIIGAGNYANNSTCAVSCTGTGEYFMRTLGAYEVSALMEHKGLKVQEAADTYIYKKLENLGGDGGLVAIDKEGNIAMPFNTEGMYRGYILENGLPKVFVYDEDRGKEFIQ
jgi:beta-aspartyl-peptidase (threonine type)